MTTRAANVELLRPWSAWVIMQMSKACHGVGGLLTVEHVGKFWLNPNSVLGLTGSRPRRMRS